MRASYASPNDANLSPCNFLLGPVYICYTLSKVELSILLGRDTLNLKEGSVRAGVALATLMAENAPFGVESIGGKSGGLVLEPETRPRHPDPTEPSTTSQDVPTHIHHAIRR